MGQANAGKTRTKGLLIYLMLLCAGLILAIGIGTVMETKKETQSATPNEAAESRAEENGQNTNYELISDYLYSYYDGYVDYVAPVCKTLRENIKLKGKKEVVKEYAELELLCLDLALEFKDKDIPDKEFESLGKALSSKQKQSSYNVPIDYEADFVASANGAWGRDRVAFFKKLLQAEPADGYQELVKKTFTREEYVEYLNELDKSREKLYDSFVKALEGFFPKIFGPSRVNAVRKRGREYTFGTIEKIYGPVQEKRSKGT